MIPSSESRPCVGLIALVPQHDDGIRSEPQVSEPSADGGSFVAVTAGALHTCAIKAGGAIACWGNDLFGQVSGPNGSPYR